MANMHLQLTGHLLGGTTAEDLMGQIRGADAVLIPGVIFRDEMTHTLNEEDPTFIVLETDLTTADVISGGDWDGQPVTQDFVTDYVLGAGPHWANSEGTMFMPLGAIAEIR